ncbi:MAG: translocation/assembly module TamB domain-containing protein [Pseudomonadota bacterium]
MGLTALLLALSLALGATPAAAQVSVLDLKNAMVQFLLRQIGAPGAFEVTAGQVTEPEEGVTALNDVRVTDGDGVWLTVDQVAFSWTPSALLSGRVEIDRLTIRGFRMTRLSGDPELQEGELAAREPAEPFSWPRSPIPLRINRFELLDVALSDRVSPQAIAFDGVGGVEDEGDAQTLRLDLRRTDAVAGRIDLAYERRFDTNTLRMALEAEEAAGGLVARLAGLPAESASRVALRAEGPPTDWRATLDARSDRIFTATGIAAIAYEGPFRAAVDLRIEPGELIDPAVRRALTPAARLVATVAEDEGGVVRVEEGRLSAADLDLTVDGRYGRADGALDFALTAEARAGLSELVPGAAFERFTLDGRLAGALEAFDLTGDAALMGLETAAAEIGDAALALRVSVAPEGIEIGADGVASGLRIDRMTPDALGEARVRFDGALRDGRFTIAEATLRSPAAQFEGGGLVDLDAGGLELRYRAAAPSLAPLLAAYGVEGDGAISANGDVAGPFGALAATGAVRGRDVALGGVDLGRIGFDHETTIASELSGSARLRSEGGDLGALAASAAYALAGERLTLSALRATAPGLEANGSAALDLGSGLATADATLDWRNLRPLTRALGQTVGGALRVDLAMRAGPGPGSGIGPTARQDLRVDMAFDSVSLDGRRYASGPGRVTVEGLGGPSGALDSAFNLGLTRRDGAPVGALEAAASGPLTALGFTAALELDEASDPVTASLSGRYLNAQGGQAGAALEIAQAEASFGRGDGPDMFRLAAPLRVDLADGAAFDALELTLPRGGSLRGALDLSAQGVVADLAVDRLDLALLGERFAAPVSDGRADVTARIDTRPGRASGALQAQARGVRIGGGVGGGRAQAASLDLDLTGAWDGRQLRVDLAGDGADGARRLAAEALLPLRPKSGGGVVASSGAPLMGALAWSGPIEDIWPLVPAPGHVLAGPTELDLEFGGSLSAPRVDGSFALNEGRYENLDTGAILEQLAVRSQIDGATRIRLDLEGVAGDGRVAAEVAVDLAAQGGPTVALRAALTKAQLLQRDDLTATLSGDLAAEGPLAAPRVTGDITIDEAEIRLVAPSGAAIPDLGPVRAARGGAGQAAEQGALAAEPPPTNAVAGPVLDLTIDAPRRIFTRGRGLDAEWRLALQVDGPASAPSVTGRSRT